MFRTLLGALALIVTTCASAQAQLQFPFRFVQPQPLEREAMPPVRRPLDLSPSARHETAARPRRPHKECREPRPEDYANDTIIIVVCRATLYHIDASGRRYTHRIGVPEPQNDNFRGEATIGAMKEWPDWKPTKDMIRKKPQYAAYVAGMGGGPKNPLGARAMYLFVNGQDTMLRIHGTNNPDTIGEEVSSGCFRLRNKEVMELYERVHVGTKVVVL